MLTIIENYSWIIILPVFVLLFAVIWNALKKSSIFPDFLCFVIALCVTILCVISVTEFFPQEHGTSQRIAAVSQENAPLQEHQQHKFHFILLPYLTLTLSFLLLLMLAKIAMLADGVKSFFKPSYGNKKKIAATNRHKKIRKQNVWNFFLNDNLKK